MRKMYLSLHCDYIVITSWHNFSQGESFSAQILAFKLFLQGRRKRGGRGGGARAPPPPPHFLA